MYDAVVIGAGLSGLAAGLRLAQYDRRVAVVERHELWGGLNSFYTKAGRRFDVGLHALTNFVPPRTPNRPLTKVLRQLRIRHEELRLGEQGHSEIRFPGLALRFTNDFRELESEVARAFPAEIDGFRRLVQEVRDYDLGDDATAGRSGRAELTRHVRDPRLADALLLPLLWYGSAREDDVDWKIFVVLFRSIFLEGLARPEGGVRTLLNLIIKRFKRTNGELLLGNGVERIVHEGGRTRGVVLDDGTELETDTVLSSAGYVETLRMAGEDDHIQSEDVGRLTFLESISVLDTTPAELGCTCATAFYCTEERLTYREPETGIDPRSGVLSAPNNFASEKPLPEGVMRVTVLANHHYWTTLSEERYRAEKERAASAAIEGAARYFGDWRPHSVFQDIFTPRTIQHFTGHAFGAVYGSPRKRWDGTTHLGGLFVCGTDQGYLGVVGAMMSGILMANKHALVPSARS